MSNLGPLMKLILAKRAEMEAASYAPRAWFHGTNTDVIPGAKNIPMWLAEDPMTASNYTAGRRSGSGSASKNGRIYPFVARDNIVDASQVDVMQQLPREDNTWLELLGIQDPIDFRQRVLKRATQSSEDDWAKYGRSESWVPYAGDLGETGGMAKWAVDSGSHSPLSAMIKPYQPLDNRPFIDTLLEELGPETSFMLEHPTPVLRFGKRGQRLPTEEMMPSTVLYAPSPGSALKSVFDFKRGGSV